MARRKRGIVEKLALGVMLVALAWFALNVVLAQMSKSETDTFQTGSELLLNLDEGEQRAVYLERGATTGAHLRVTPSDLDCRLEPSGDDEMEAVLGKRSNRAALVDGWNVHDEVVVYSAPSTGTYRLGCTDAGSEFFFPDGSSELVGISAGAELLVAEPVDAAPSWVSPKSALGLSFTIVALGGLVWVVSALFRPRGS